MLFHWPRVYGALCRKATATANNTHEVLLESAFKMAAEAAPEVFAADSRSEPAQQAKFENLCPWLALTLLPLEDEARRELLEQAIDRIEVGLREAGAGDMKVGVKVRAYAAAMNGRLGRYMPLIMKKDWKGLVAACSGHGVTPAVVENVRLAYEKGLARAR